MTIPKQGVGKDGYTENPRTPWGKTHTYGYGPSETVQDIQGIQDTQTPFTQQFHS